jgi:hypothetical protein
MLGVEKTQRLKPQKQELPPIGIDQMPNADGI